MNIDFNKLLTVTFTLFAVIDILGSFPILISLKQKIGGINELKATLISGAINDPLYVYWRSIFRHIRIGY